MAIPLPLFDNGYWMGYCRREAFEDNINEITHLSVTIGYCAVTYYATPAMSSILPDYHEH